MSPKARFAIMLPIELKVQNASVSSLNAIRTLISISRRRKLSVSFRTTPNLARLFGSLNRKRRPTPAPSISTRPRAWKTNPTVH